MDCLLLPVSILKRRRCRLGYGYQPLSQDGDGDGAGAGVEPVVVVVGKEKKEFLVDPFVLEENPFQVLMELGQKSIEEDGRQILFVDHVDAILFEHMLWLFHRHDSASLFHLHLNLKDIIEFYSHDS